MQFFIEYRHSLVRAQVLVPLLFLRCFRRTLVLNHRLQEPFHEEPFAVADVILEVLRHLLPGAHRALEAKVSPANGRIRELVVRCRQAHPDLQHLLPQLLVG